MSYDFGGRNYEIYAVKKEDITSSGRPAATLIPHERVLQYNKSNPIFFKNNLNNNIQQTFYGPNTDILRTNNLVCWVEMHLQKELFSQKYKSCKFTIS